MTAVTPVSVEPARVFILDKDEQHISLMETIVRGITIPGGMRCATYMNIDFAVKDICQCEHQPDLMIVGLDRHGFVSGFNVIDTVHQKWPELKCILSTGHHTHHSRIVEVMKRHGIFAYIARPYDVLKTRGVIEAALSYVQPSEPIIIYPTYPELGL